MKEFAAAEWQRAQRTAAWACHPAKGLSPRLTHYRDYDFLMDLREAGDYGGLAQVTADSAKTATEKAAGFIEALKHMCPELG